MKIHGKMKHFSASLTLILVLAIPQLLWSASFTALGDFDGGPFESRAYGVSADGKTVAVTGYTNHISGSLVYAMAGTWTAANGLTPIGVMTPNDPRSFGKGISGDGSVVVGFSQPDHETTGMSNMAFRWTASGGMKGLWNIGGPASYAEAVSADGTTVVGRSQNGNYRDEAFIWTEAGGMVGLGHLQGGEEKSAATGVSGDGSVVVGYSKTNAGPYEAFRWTSEGGMTGMGAFAGGKMSRAFGISDNGKYIVGCAADADWNVEAFLWSEAQGMIGLGDLPGEYAASQANAVSEEGTIVVGTSNTAKKAIIWTEADGLTSIEDLLAAQGIDITGWNLKEATDVSADGLTIVGNGINPDGNQEAWMVSLDAAPVPVPSAIWLLSSGLLGLLGIQRRSRA